MSALWTMLWRWLTHAPLTIHQTTYTWGYVFYKDGSPALLGCMFLGGLCVGAALWITFPHGRLQPSSRAYVVLMSSIVGNSVLGAFKGVEYAPSAIWKYHALYALNDAVLALGTYVALRLLMRLHR